MMNKSWSVRIKHAKEEIRTGEMKSIKQSGQSQEDKENETGGEEEGEIEWKWCDGVILDVIRIAFN